MATTIANTTKANQQRYRLPGIERAGIAQLSLLETALWPLQGGPLADSVFTTGYQFQQAGKTATAAVRVFAPLGLQPIDEYVLWGLLGMTLERMDSAATL